MSTLSLGNMELFGSELGILMMVIVMVMTMLAVEYHLFGVELNIFTNSQGQIIQVSTKG